MSGTRLVRFQADDGLMLNGLLVEGGSDVTVVHVHGKCGNFYENTFVSDMMVMYAQAGLNLLTFNNRGHACMAEAYRAGRVVYVGGSLEEFTECVLDIRAAVQFAQTLGDIVVLQGHSHGCEKILYYVQTTGTDSPIVLLSPTDSYRLQQRYLASASGESVEQ